MGNNRQIKVNKKIRLGLVLGGGGGLGAAHIGVIKAFEELGIDFDYVAGTSAGSLVGALYASGLKSQQMEEIARDLKVKDIKNSNFILKPSTAENIAGILNNIWGKELVFSELKKPFTAVCTNMKNGQEAHINYGSVAKAVSGSCAVPGIFKPVEYDNMHLVDGGLRNNLPTDVALKMGANVIIAVELNHSRGFGTPSLNMFKVLTSSLGIMMASSVAPKLKLADIVLQPNMQNFSKANLDNLDDRIALGYDCVMASINEIAKVLKRKPRRKVIYAQKNKVKQNRNKT